MELKSCSKSSLDNTLKYQFLTTDNYIIEACVVFFQEKVAPIVICVSSQIGCQCSCSFCITGNKRFVRNLSSEEIEAQLSLIIKNNPRFLEHKFEVTYMGTGEPLHNKYNVFTSAKNLSYRYEQLHKINISSTFPNVDISLTDILSIRVPVHFQYSLHFVSDKLRKEFFRTQLAPICSVIGLLNQIHTKTGDIYCINYILFDTINDQKQDADALIEMLQPLPAYLKISKYCPINCSTLKASPFLDDFTSLLSGAGIKWKLFESKGTDIHAACGHLLSDIQF